MTRSLRFWARALLAAMLLATLAPAISRTLTASRSAGDWVQICTGTQVRWVQVAAASDTASGNESKSSLARLDGCGHCLLAAERFAPLIPSLPVFTGPAQTWQAPMHRVLALISASSPCPSARGPPLLS